MQLTNTQILPVRQADAWAALNDAELLQQCIPGCDTMMLMGSGNYEIVIAAAIGPVRARFKGRLVMENMSPPDSYDLRFEGQGGAAGHGKGTAKVWLESAGDSETTLHYSVSATVGGKLAQLGSRLVDMAAEKMAADFFAAFKAAVSRKFPSAAPTDATPRAPTTVDPGAWGRFRAWLSSLFWKRHD
ncbi:MAG TPA: carbon monoxide dehydrogenase subunit G [Ramlibacter sp.]|nr:carbon monoxide dehydrogenase subunit G [Ramlibacter sp.]